jgi:hypothetical protein
MNLLSQQNYANISNMLRLNLEPKHSHDGSSGGGVGNTAKISDLNQTTSRFHPYQIPESFIPIEPKDFKISPNIPVELSQIEAMRKDLFSFQNIPDAENPILISDQEFNTNKGPSTTSVVEKSVNEANLVTSEIFQTLEESANDIDDFIEKNKQTISEVEAFTSSLKRENDPFNIEKILKLEGILLMLKEFIEAYRRDLSQVADFYRIMYLIAKPNPNTSSVNLKFSNPKFFINDTNDQSMYIEGLANPKPSNLGEARFSVTYRSKISRQYTAEAKDFIVKNITPEGLPSHLETFKPQLRLDFSEEVVRTEKRKRKVVCMDLDILTNKSIFVNFRNKIYGNLEGLTGKNYSPAEWANPNKKAHHLPLSNNQIYSDEEFAQLVNTFRLHFNFSKPKTQV